MMIRWLLNLLANRAVDSTDVWPSTADVVLVRFITLLAIIEALQTRISGKETSWTNTGAGQKTSWTEIPNVMMFFALAVSQVVALIRFFQPTCSARLILVFVVVFVQLWQLYFEENLLVARGESSESSTSA
ncbi:hypothetical protein PINS_up006896 [Pythium insidiosum]|nr:hypothetical protein PINS_up006896 [Pythium insidiosum]